MKLYLIRHGQTDWNTAGRIQGSTDIPLNETGRQQAECLAKGMEKRPIVRIFSSELVRAADTAAAVGHNQHVEVELLKGLEEVRFGCWEGKTWKEVQEEFPEAFSLWCLNPVEVVPPGGEAKREIQLRCKMAADYMMAQASQLKGDVAVISHGAMLAYLLKYLMRDHPMDDEVIVNNVSITTVDYNPLTEDCVLLEVNDTKHLNEL